MCRSQQTDSVHEELERPPRRYQHRPWRVRVRQLEEARLRLIRVSGTESRRESRECNDLVIGGAVFTVASARPSVQVKNTRPNPVGTESMNQSAMLTAKIGRVCNRGHKGATPGPRTAKVSECCQVTRTEMDLTLTLLAWPDLDPILDKRGQGLTVTHYKPHPRHNKFDFILRDSGSCQRVHNRNLLTRTLTLAYFQQLKKLSTRKHNHHSDPVWHGSQSRLINKVLFLTAGRHGRHKQSKLLSKHCTIDEAIIMINFSAHQYRHKAIRTKDGARMVRPGAQ
ncbi:hypothetical protein RRG08_043754 [Elysia crispata]|uniref:Uncharacterized protein n=1 Tax=Elysia crispata TaxID=231223 RepID=A0AAE0ZN72_9GAST|nr:hypothetical protein RRG08_043754 [Elysia crispata]